VYYARVILILITFFSLHKKGFNQIEHYSEFHKISIEGTNIFEEVRIRGKVTDNDGAKISISYHGLEVILDLKLTYYAKKIKKVKQKDFIKTSLVTSSFYDGVNSYQHYIESPSFFTLSYKIKRDDLMYLSTLDFFTYYKCDSINYELIIPVEKKLHYNIPFNIENLNIDSVIENEYCKYSFYQYENSRTPLVDSKKSKSPYIVSNNTSKVIRIQISDFDNPKKALNNWYSKLVKSTGELDNNSKKEIDSLLNGISDKELIAKELFKFIQNKIRYLDIEDGVNAFVPRDVNDILTKRQGDCKDMSNLLVKALNFKGIEARIALASSLSHRFELDFPNIASANHVICAVKKDKNWIIADATDKYCQYSIPSIHMQGRNIFIINDKEGVFHKIEKISYKENLDSSYSKLKMVDGIISGRISMNLSGLANRSYVRLEDYNNEKKLELGLKKKLLNNYELYAIDSLTYDINQDNSILTFNIVQRNPGTTKVKNRVYLPIKCLIQKFHEFPKKIDKNDRLTTYHSLNKKGKIILHLDSDVSLAKHISNEFNKPPFRFSFIVEKLSGNILKIEYEIIIDAVEIKEKDIETYTEFDEIVKSLVNKSIIYEKKND
jgi:Transglutaminase-like superfamily